MKSLDDWIATDAINVDSSPTLIDSKLNLGERLARARMVFLGETNHFVEEKAVFRLWWLQQLARHRRLVVGEELGWSDGRHIARYLTDGDSSHLDQVATFGYRGHLRKDRDDSPTGIFRHSAESYPHALMKTHHESFYHSLRTLGIEDYFGFDVDSPGGAYGHLVKKRLVIEEHELSGAFWEHLRRVPGESMQEEAVRLRELYNRIAHRPTFELVREDLMSLIESLEYSAIVNPAQDYDATRPAMALREQSMKRRLGHLISRTDPDSLVVLMGHAFHLAKNDRGIEGNGVGPGGDQVSSLGHHLVNEQSHGAYAVWMVYGGGKDSQPLPDLPNDALYPDDSLNRQLGSLGEPTILPVTSRFPDQQVTRVGHLYQLVSQVNLAQQADALMYFPNVTPLGSHTSGQ